MNDIKSLKAHFSMSSYGVFRQSQIYSYLTQSISNDVELLSICSNCPRNQPPSFLFLGVVHKLILQQRSDHPLRNIYNILYKGELPLIDPYPSFRSFSLKYRQEIISELNIRRVQTSEAGRSVFLAIALQYANEKLLKGNHKWSVVDLGAGAGLNLLWEDYSLEIINQSLNNGNIIQYGTGEADVYVRCKTYGISPISYDSIPQMIEKIGIEINPIDINDDDEVLWLLALIWPDQPIRKQRLVAALDWARQNLPCIVHGNVLTQLDLAVSQIITDSPLCIFQSFLLPQLSKQEQDLLESKIEQIAKRRDMLYVNLEGHDGDILLSIRSYKDGVLIVNQTIAQCHPHGDWLKWI